MPLVFRSVKGAPLTIAEADGNITQLRDWITALQAVSEPVVSIDYIETVGRMMTVHLTDHSEQGPFQLPLAAWTSRGKWAPLTSYSAMDVITNNAQVYLVLLSHESASTFSPTATDGLGHDLYSLMMVNPNSPSINRTGTEFTPTILDVNTYNRMMEDHATTVFLGSFGAEPDAEMHFRQVGSGPVVFEALSPVLIHGVDGYVSMLGRQGATCTLKCVGEDEWDLMGLLLEGASP